MKLSLSILFIALIAFAQAQSFQVLGSDAEGDDMGNLGTDLKSIAIKTDLTQDSIWIRFETYDTIAGDWGFSVLFDTNMVDNDGKDWNFINYGPNDDLTYDMKLDLFNNKYFPPTHAILYDTSGLKFTQDIVLIQPDSTSIIARFKLSSLDADGKFNLLAGGGSFDGAMYDNIPNSSYYNYDASSVGTEPIQPASFSVYPNPAHDHIFIQGLSQNANVRLYNLLGETLLESKLTTGQNSVDIASLPDGIYILNIKSQGESISHKIYKH